MQNNNNKPTYIFALGGLEEIGKNTYIIENDEEIFIFDAGIKFANDELLGMNGTVANFTYLKENEHKIKALIITHGHEDHIGGVPYLLKLVNIPIIYAPLLPAKLIEKKLAEYRDIQVPPIEIYDDDTVLKFPTAEIDFCRVSHSIPDSFMLFVKTANGNIVSTGDFRFDFATNGDETNLKKLLDFARRNVDVLLCESTSSDVPGFSESDKYIIDNLKTMLINAPGRVLISTFASHLARIEEVIAVSIKLGRKVLILGKSMQENVKISRKIGYLNINEEDIINPKEIDQYQDNEILIILTGSQGEPTAALNVMSKGEHSKISLKPDDTVILSSNPIPGNYANVDNMTNNLCKRGVKIIENRPECRIHSSGHATRSEQQLMIKALDPKYVFPIHGEYKMLRSLQNNAIDSGFPKERVLITVNGHKLQLINHELSYTDIWVPAIPMYIDGKTISSDSHNIIEERSVLSDNGIVHILVNLDQTKTKQVNNVIISTRGCFFTRTSTNFLSKISYSITTAVNEKLADFTKSQYNEAELVETISSLTKTLVWKYKKKNPYIYVSIFVKDSNRENNLEKLYAPKLQEIIEKL